MDTEKARTQGRPPRLPTMMEVIEPCAASPSPTTLLQQYFADAGSDDASSDDGGGGNDDDDDDDPIAWYGNGGARSGDFFRRSLETIMEEPTAPLPRTPLPRTPQPAHLPRLAASKARTADQAHDSSSIETFHEKPASSDDYPDGGLRAWIVVVAAATAHFCTVGVMVGCAGSWADVYSRQALEVPTTPEIVGVIPSAGVCAMLVSAAWFNSRHDRTPPIWFLPFASLMFALFVCLESVFSSTYSALVVTHFLAGISAGAVLSSATAAVESWFLEERDLALALATLGGPVGGTVLPAALLSLSRLVGTEWAIRIIGFVMVVLLGAACLAARPRHGRIFSLGDSNTETSQNKTHTPQERRPLSWVAYRSAFAEGPTLILTAAAVFVTLGAMLPVTFITFQAGAGLRLSNAVTTLLLPVFFLGALVAQLASPYVACALGRFNIATVSLAIGAAAALGVWMPLATDAAASSSKQSAAAIAAAMAVVGFSAGIFVSGIPELIEGAASTAASTLTSKMTAHPRAEEPSFRARAGLVLVASGVAVIVGVPAAGLAIRTGGVASTGDDFLSIKILCGTSLALAAVLVLCMRWLVVGLRIARA